MSHSVALGLAFLYAADRVLIIYSFNASRLVTVWAGWSTRWYVELLNDGPCCNRPGSHSGSLALASAATVLGTLAALALVRLDGFAVA